nr:DsrE family protein [Candidatus Sigynarchaeota archaeon]
MASGLQAMDIKTMIVLFGEAIFTLLKNQDGTSIHIPAMNGALDILAMSEGRIAAVQEDMDILGITKEDLVEYPYLEIIDREQLDLLLTGAQCTLRF